MWHQLMYTSVNSIGVRHVFRNEINHNRVLQKKKYSNEVHLVLQCVHTYT